MTLIRQLSVIALGAALLAAPAIAKDAKDKGPPPEKVTVDPNPFPSTYAPKPAAPVLFRNATVLDGIGGRMDGADVLVSGGKIAAVGQGLDAPDGAQVIDATGKWLTPGIIDMHSHLGVYPSPGIQAHSDGNEATGANTAEVWMEHSLWPQDPGFNRARIGGVTSLLILPGSANLFGGRGVVVKNVPSVSVQGMKFPGAPYALKMACGENPKRVYGGRRQAPGTRAGNFAGYRTAWIEAADYAKSWADYEKKYESDPHEAKAPKRDLEKETLAAALSGDILVHMHCYRADEMMLVLDMAREFGYQVAAFHHAVEAYKIADTLAKENVCGALWADWWGFKVEAYDAIRENIPFVHAAGGCAAVHSDSDIGIQRLNQEAAKALADGNRAGLSYKEEDAWVWLSANPAKAIGVFDQTGSIEVGKAADLVLWTGNPLKARTRTERVLIDGATLFDRDDPATFAVSDFDLGQPARLRTRLFMEEGR